MPTMKSFDNMNILDLALQHPFIAFTLAFLLLISIDGMRDRFK